MLISIVRTIIIYGIIVMVMRIMGKRQIAQLQPFELVVAIMIAELASIPMQETGIPLIRGITPVFILLFLQVMLSYISLWNQKSRKIFSGSPSIVINKGKIEENELRKLRYNINDLLEQLRGKDYPDVNQIEYAILETNGQLSVIEKQSGNDNLQLPVTLIMDGVVQSKTLKSQNIDEQWLDDRLKGFGIQRPQDAFIAMLDTNGNLFAQPKENIKDKEAG